MIMLRRLRIISAVVFLMAIVAWGCSYFSPWVLAWNWIFRMEHGTVNILWMTTGSKSDYQFGAFWDGFVGFRTDWWFTITWMLGMKGVVVPLWVPTMASAAFAVGARGYDRRRSRIRRDGGLCLGCGYDLRGSSERCPECAQPFTRETQQADASV